MKSKKSNKKIIMIIVIIAILLILILSLGLLISNRNSDPYGDRCSDQSNYKISSDTIKKVKNKFEEIDKVNSVEIETKLCTIKIFINLKEDVDLEIVKEKAKDALTLFSEDELGYYDFALYVTSDNKESEVYPIDVSKHSSREDFAW